MALAMPQEEGRSRMVDQDDSERSPPLAHGEHA